MKENTKLQGFFRVQITEGDKIVSDSGWQENQVTNDGINQYLANWLVGDTANGKSVTHMALGTGSQPASNGTVLQGEVTKRAAVSTSIVDSRTAQFTAQFASADSFVGAGGADIANIGLFNTSSGGTIFAGNTYTSSSCASNQNVNATYQIRFASA